MIEKINLPAIAPVAPPERPDNQENREKRKKERERLAAESAKKRGHEDGKGTIIDTLA